MNIISIIDQFLLFFAYCCFSRHRKILKRLANIIFEKTQILLVDSRKSIASKVRRIQACTCYVSCRSERKFIKNLQSTTIIIQYLYLTYCKFSSNIPPMIKRKLIIDPVTACLYILSNIYIYIIFKPLFGPIICAVDHRNFM